ncbi:hypothetical protein BDB01DRAFT_809451, partial [Pilobolus umbonatus]
MSMGSSISMGSSTNMISSTTWTSSCGGGMKKPKRRNGIGLPLERLGEGEKGYVLHPAVDFPRARKEERAEKKQEKEVPESAGDVLGELVIHSPTHPKEGLHLWASVPKKNPQRTQKVRQQPREKQRQANLQEKQRESQEESQEENQEERKT